MKDRIQFWLFLQNICSQNPNEKDLSSFAQKMNELEQFLFGPAEFSDI